MSNLPWPDWVVWLALAALALNLLLVLVLLLRGTRRPADVASRDEVRQLVQGSVSASSERLERELRQEVGDQARGSRQELGLSLDRFQAAVTGQAAEAVRTQNAQVDALAAQLTQLRGTLGDTVLYILDAPHLYNRSGSIYLGPDGQDWPDNPFRFAALCMAAAVIATDGIDGWP